MGIVPNQPGGRDFVPRAGRASMSGRGRSRLKPSPAAALTLHFFVALFDKAFAFAVLALYFFLIRGFRHARLQIQCRCLFPGDGECRRQKNAPGADRLGHA
jgi:hypothetical protein